MSLGERIAALRSAASLTQENLSALAGIDVQALQRAETGRTAMSLERLDRVASALGVTLSDLFAAGDFSSSSTVDPDEVKASALLRQMGPEARALALDLLAVVARRSDG